MSLDNAARQWGERQVRRMLHDRPMMAEHGDKAKVLYEWAARKFAGEDLRAQIVWDASTPSTDAESRGQIDGKSGVIRVRGTYYDGPKKGKPKPFERTWCQAVFELYNVTGTDQFQSVEREAAAGRLTREQFATKMTEIESSAAEKTRSFYIHVFLPWAKENHFATDPYQWYLATRQTPGEDPLLRDELRKRGEHWKYLERCYDEIKETSGGSKKGDDGR